MDDKCDGLLGVVRLKPLDRGGRGELLGIEYSRDLVLFGVGLLQHDREWNSEVRRERNGVPVKLEGHRGELILERENTPSAFEVCDYGDAVKNSRRCKILTRVFICLAFHGYDRRTDALALGPFGDVLAANIELVSRREFVERGVPLRTRIGLVCEQKVPLRTGYGERLGPRVEFGAVNDLRST